MNFDNEVKIVMDSKSQNEYFARICVAGFVSILNPTIDELTDIKTAVSEAVTNAIVHGYENKKGYVYLDMKIKDSTLYIEITDKGVGITDIEQAKEALYTSKPEQERSGMGFTVMESFMDTVEIFSDVCYGTTIRMSKKINQASM